MTVTTRKLLPLQLPCVIDDVTSQISIAPNSEEQLSFSADLHFSWCYSFAAGVRSP